MTSHAEHAVRHLLPVSLRAVIVAGACWVLSLSLTVASGSVAALLGSLCACYLLDPGLKRAALAQVRTGALLMACLALWLTGLVLAGLFSGVGLMADLLTPLTAFNTAEAVKWFTLAAAITAALRTLAHRTAWGPVLEILFVATAVVVTLAAHRNGMIHRPFFIGDFALIRGLDPSAILMAFGCAAVIALAALLMMEHNQRRLPWHFTVLGLLCFSLLAYVRLFGLPAPGMTDDLGLTGRQQAGAGDAPDNPFQDGENSATDREAPVAVVVFRDDYEPINGAYYFRESAYSRFNGAMLDFAGRSDMDQDLIGHFTSSRVESGQLPGAADQRKAVRTTIGMLVPHRSPFGLDSPVAYQTTANPYPLRFKRTYDAWSQVPDYDFEYLLGRETGRGDWSEAVRQEYLTLPADPRYRELAESLTANMRPEYAADPFAKAWTIKNWLDDNGIYSLRNEHAYEPDPAASFLFGDLTGYCMHFAFAATYLYRSIGIPARVGIGYSVPAENRAGGSSLLIQAIHGHAWPEIYFRDVGWVIVDPAPRQTLVEMTTDPQDDLQQLLGDMLRNDASFEDFMASRQSPFIELQVVLNAVYLIVALGLGGAWLVKLHRLSAPLYARPQSQYRVSYRAALDRLAAVGLRRRTGESREQFARRTAESVPGLEALTRSHLACALGGDVAGNQQWTALRQAVASDVRRNTAIWKQIAGWLNPFSWLLSR